MINNDKYLKLGFTLIELLAVIIILAIIALIATPRIMNSISNSRKGAFNSTAFGLYKSAENSYVQNKIKELPEETITYYFEDGHQSVDPDNGLYPKLNFQGTPPLNGYIRIFQSGDIEMALTDGEWYVSKDFDSNNLNEIEKYIDQSLFPSDYVYAIPDGIPIYSNEDISDLINNHDYIPISTANELHNIRYNNEQTFGSGTEWEGTYTGGLGQNYIQVNNINLPKYENWTPLGYNESSNDSYFSGIYNGNNLTISNLTILDTREVPTSTMQWKIGLFSRVSGEIENVNVINANVTTIRNEHSRSVSYDAGILVGELRGVVRNSRAHGNIRTSIDFSWGSSSGGIGGLVGAMRGGGGSLVDGSIADVNIYSDHHRSGGSIGVGGLVGYMMSTRGNNTIVRNSYANGNIEGKCNNGGIGGLVGFSWRNNGGTCLIEKTYSYSDVNNTVANQESRTGGLVGTAVNCNVNNSYYDTLVSNQNDEGKGTPKSTNELSIGVPSSEIFNTWSNDIWNFDDDNDYPRLKWDNLYPYTKSNISMTLDRTKFYIEIAQMIPVATAEEFNQIRYSEENVFGTGTEWEGTYSGGLDKKYIQVNDISLESYSNWIPFGYRTESNDTYFSGFYDGNYKSITDLKIVDTRQVPTSTMQWKTGLFSRISGIVINLNVLDAEVVTIDNPENRSISYDAGILVGELRGVIKNSHASGTVTTAEDFSWRFSSGGIGGLAGAMRGGGGSLIENSSADVQIDADYTQLGGSIGVGGLVGYMMSTSGNNTIVKNSYAHGNVYGKCNNGGIGGLVGFSWRNNGGTCLIEKTYSYSAVTNKVENQESRTGGLVGTAVNCNVNNSYYDTLVSNQNDEGKGTPKTTVELQNGIPSSEIFNTWSTSIWDFGDSNQYPKIKK